MSDRRRIFLSYARPDASIAQALAAKLENLGIVVWADFNSLSAGTDFAEAISEGIQQSDGLVVIASERSKRSSWIEAEIGHAANNGTPIFPIVVDDFKFLPSSLQRIQALKIDTRNFESTLAFAAREIDRWLEREQPSRRFDSNFAEKFSRQLADEAAKAGSELTDDAPRSVFVVHGHDDVSFKLVTDYLREIDVIPVVLREIEEQEDSLLRRFLRIAEKAMFAIVIFSPDDFGASLKHYNAPKGGERALRYRARQNVVLELGFFLGKLKDFNKVFVLLSKSDEPWPEFELPSDLAGTIYKEIDAEGRWKRLLRTALIRNGIQAK